MIEMASICPAQASTTFFFLLETTECYEGKTHRAAVDVSTLVGVAACSCGGRMEKQKYHCWGGVRVKPCSKWTPKLENWDHWCLTWPKLSEKSTSWLSGSETSTGASHSKFFEYCADASRIKEGCCFKIASQSRYRPQRRHCQGQKRSALPL